MLAITRGYVPVIAPHFFHRKYKWSPLVTCSAPWCELKSPAGIRPDPLGINAAQASRILDRFGANHVLSHLAESASVGFGENPAIQHGNFDDRSPFGHIWIIILIWPPIFGGPSHPIPDHSILDIRPSWSARRSARSTHFAHFGPLPMQLTNLKSWSQSRFSRTYVFVVQG